MKRMVDDWIKLVETFYPEKENKGNLGNQWIKREIYFCLLQYCLSGEEVYITEDWNDFEDDKIYSNGILKYIYSLEKDRIGYTTTIEYPTISDYYSNQSNSSFAPRNGGEIHVHTTN